MSVIQLRTIKLQLPVLTQSVSLLTGSLEDKTIIWKRTIAESILRNSSALWSKNHPQIFMNIIILANEVYLGYPNILNWALSKLNLSWAESAEVARAWLVKWAKHELEFNQAESSWLESWLSLWTTLLVIQVAQTNPSTIKYGLWFTTWKKSYY